MTNDAAAVARARSIAGLTAFVALLVVLAFVVETLSQIGVSSKILVWLVAGFCLAVPAVVAIAARTISSGEFALAGRNVALGENAVTAATAIFGGVFAIAIAAASFRSEGEMSALVLGLCGGCLIAGILTAPYFRRSGCATPGDFLSARFGSRLLGAVAALVAASALFPMLVAQLSIAAMIADWTLGIGRQPALVAAALLLLLPPLLGGMRGVTVTALVQFLLALIVFVVVGVWMSAVVTGSSLPPVAYAIAIAEPSGIEATANVGNRGRHLERCRPDALCRARRRLVSGFADPLGNRTLVGVGALVDCLDIVRRRDLLRLRGDHGRAREIRARRHGPPSLARLVVRRRTLDFALGRPRRDTGHHLRAAGTGCDSHDRRLRDKTLRTG